MFPTFHDNRSQLWSSSVCLISLCNVNVKSKVWLFIFYCLNCTLIWQIRLWESDLNRVEMTLAYFYDEFPSRVIWTTSLLIDFCHLSSYFSDNVRSYVLNLAGCLWSCLWICTRSWWSAMGGFKKNASISQGRNSHEHARVSSGSKQVDNMYSCPKNAELSEQKEVT